jgi:tripartite-type tricarboxylate transporter receptor subunit TctC
MASSAKDGSAQLKGGPLIRSEGKLTTMAVTLMLASGLSLTSGADVALAQTQYPSATVKMLVGFPAGTAPDTLARLLADRLQPALGQPVVIEAAVGAGGNIAADRAAKAAPDGHTLLMAGNASLVVNQSLYDRLPFDPVKDFVLISQVAITPNVLVVHPDVPAKSVQELVAIAKANPDELTYAHVGVGTSLHLAGELFKQAAGIAIRPVAYRGGNTIYPDLLAGRISLCFCNIATALPLVREGKLRALAVTSLKSSPVAPDLPTMDASGFPGFQADAWFGLVAPTGTPTSVIATLHSETARALSEAGMRKTLLEFGMVPVGNSPEEFAAVIKSERPYWHTVVESLGLKLQ